MSTLTNTTTPQPIEQSPDRLEQRIAIEPDGVVVVRSGKIEYGQGIRTGFAKMVAEELGVPLGRIRVELGETDRVPWDIGTFGSMSTSVDGKVVRAAAAFARTLLLERAAARFKVPVSELKIADSQVVAPDGRAVSYPDLVGNEPLTGLIPETMPDHGEAPPPEDVPFRLEGLAIVTGKACYSGDVRRPGMLWGQALHPPVPGSEILSLDDSNARALPGVVAIVRAPDFAGVVAERSQQAVAAVRSLQVEWKRPEATPEPPVEVVLRCDPRVASAFESASHCLAAEYHAPHISHVPIGPSAAVADVRADEADFYVTTQRPFGLRDQAAQLLGIPAGNIHVHPQMMSGTYGRGNSNDAAMDAARLSRAVKSPVLVQWSREEEFRSSPHRPLLDAQISAALDAEGTITAWRYLTQTNPHTYGRPGALPPGVLEGTSGRNAVPPYRLGSLDVVLRVAPAQVRTGAYRSLAAALNVFAIESFMDELAIASGQDPIAFRLRHIEDERLRRVLCAVRERSRWDQRPRHSGHGSGVSCTSYHGTYVAVVFEVAVDSADQVRIEQVWCVIDAGRLVHPDGARNQTEGAIQQAASWTLLEELPLAEGRIVSTSLRDYRIASFRDAIPRMDIAFVPAQEFPSSGIGEAGTVPVAAAVANAVCEACSARVRRLPLTPAAVFAARNYNKNPLADNLQADF